MKHAVNLSKDHSYVHVVMTGGFALRDFEICREEAAQMLSANELKRLFVDFSQGVNNMPFIDDYNFTKQHPFHFPPGTKIALVVSADEVSNLQIVETVSKNQGTNLTLFSDNDLALNWLAEN